MGSTHSAPSKMDQVTINTTYPVISSVYFVVHVTAQIAGAVQPSIRPCMHCVILSPCLQVCVPPFAIDGTARHKQKTC